MDQKTTLFNLLDTAYNTLPDKYVDFKTMLLKNATILNNNGDYLKVISDLYHALTLLTAEDRLNVPAIQAIAAVVVPAAQKLTQKELRQANLATGVVFGPLIF